MDDVSYVIDGEFSSKKKRRKHLLLATRRREGGGERFRKNTPGTLKSELD